MRNSSRYKVACSSLPLGAPGDVIDSENEIPQVDITLPMDGFESSERVVRSIEDSHLIGLYYDSFLGFTNHFIEKFGIEGIDEYEIFRISNQSVPMIILALLLLAVILSTRGCFQNFWRINDYLLTGFVIAGIEFVVLTIIIILRTFLYTKVNITSRKLLIWKKRILRFYSSRTGRALENFLIVTAQLVLVFMD